MGKHLRTRGNQCMNRTRRCWHWSQASPISFARFAEEVGDSGMTTHRGIRALATAALIAAALTSCDNGSNDPAASGSPTPSSSAPTTATAKPPSETELASSAASVALEKYYDVRNQLRQDPNQPLSLLRSVAISTELAAQQNLFKKERKQGLHQVGRTKIAGLDVQAVNLDNSDPKTGKVPTVQVDLCYDVSEVDIVDADGASVVGPNRPDTGWIQFLVSNYEWDSNPDGGWRIASSQDLERKPCEAS